MGGSDDSSHEESNDAITSIEDELDDRSDSREDVLQSNKAESDKLSHGDEISIGDENEFDDLNYDETPFQEEEEEEEVPSVQHGNLDDMATAISSDENEDDGNKVEGASIQSGRSNDKLESAKDLEDGEFDDDEPKKDDGELEEGEIKSDSDDDIPIIREIDPEPVHSKKPEVSSNLRPKTMSDRPEDYGICKWFVKGTCTWGVKCNFIHPKEEDRQLWRQRMNQLQNNRPRILPPAQTPTPLMSFTMNTTPAPPEMSAWEQGLLLARKRMHPQNAHNGNDSRGSQIFSPRSGEDPTYESSSSTNSNRRNLGPRITYGEPPIPSLIDLSCPPPNAGLQTSYPSHKNIFNKTRDKRILSSHETSHRRRSKSSSRSSSPSNRQLKSQAVVPSRATFKPTDPWARKNSNRKKKRTSRSRSSSANRSHSRSRSRSGTYSLVSSSRSPSLAKVRSQKKKSSRRSASSSSASSDTYKSSSSSSSSSSESSTASSLSSRKKKRNSKSDKSKSARENPTEKRARSGYETTKLRSLLQDDESAKAADFSSYRIPKRKRTPSPPSPPRSKKSKKNRDKEKSRKNGSNSLANDNGDETPMAFKARSEREKPRIPTPEAQDISSDDDDTQPNPPLSDAASSGEKSPSSPPPPPLTKDDSMDVSDDEKSSDDSDTKPTVSVVSSEKDGQSAKNEVQPTSQETMSSSSKMTSDKKRKSGGERKKHRQELLEQLKSIEEAIAKKRNRLST